MSSPSLKNVGFELAYLSLLTKAGLKPLSRWEEHFDSETEAILRAQGLKTLVVERSVASGKHLRELLFSTTDRCLEVYASRFDRTAICPSRANLRIEGRLFGYPSCCVEHYGAHGYRTNSLRRSDQRILFHWACPQCAITPLLLPYYRKVHRECRLAMRRRMLSLLPPFSDQRLASHLKQAVAVAASLVALGTGLTTGRAAPDKTKPDPHWLSLPAWDDPDLDLLATWEETILGNNPANPDENGNLQPDGSDLARALSMAIDSLPTEPSAVEPYLQHHMVFGLETCDICGVLTNMGVIEIVQPLENQSIALPYISKHFLEHGSFSYTGSVHAGRANPALLNLLFTARGLGHFLPEPAGTDADNDGLRDWEEPAFQTDPARPDTDGDQVRDGIDLARDLHRALEVLPRVGRPEDGPKDRPFVVEHPMDGIETCPRCGVSVVMDIWEVINPISGGVITVPSMALHYLEHGGCTWQGGQLLGGQGRVDPRQLQAVLTGQGDGHHLHITPDSDGDLLADREELDLASDPQNPDENRNQVLDGPELAQTLATDIAALTTKPGPDHVYRLDFQARGLERCDICGTNVNMGHLTVCNPMAHLYAKTPYIALHYFEHGSFSYAGNVHGQDRDDVKLSVDALRSAGPSHLRPGSGDTDQDGLSDLEERRFGTDLARPDTDNDGVPDGFHLAHGMWEAAQALPRTVAATSYVVEHPLRGLVTCDICGAQVNMGHMEIINPREEIIVDLPYLALHALRHGSFAYTPQDRLNPALLDLALRGNGTSHLTAWPGDTDQDGLLDDEEAQFGTDPLLPDTNDDGVLDGVALARSMHRRIIALPPNSQPGKTYLIHHEANCVAPCPVCLQNFNCGFARITNSWAEISTDISYMNLHFMEHGSFAVSPTERADPMLLDAILRPAVVIAAQDDQVTLRWFGKTGRIYQVFTAPDLSGPWTDGPVFPGHNTDIVFTENRPPGTDRRFYRVEAR